MKIAYISDYSPLDINAWSGTPYYVYQSLSKKHTVVWIGKDLFYFLRATPLTASLSNGLSGQECLG